VHPRSIHRKGESKQTNKQNPWHTVRVGGFSNKIQYNSKNEKNNPCISFFNKSLMQLKAARNSQIPTPVKKGVIWI